MERCRGGSETAMGRRKRQRGSREELLFQTLPQKAWGVTNQRVPLEGGREEAAERGGHHCDDPKRELRV